MRKLLLVIFLALFSAYGSPQGPPTDEKIKMEVGLVRVDTLVLRNGKPVTGLEKKDFAIYEDGVEQEIKYLSAEPVPLSIVILADQSGSLVDHFGELKVGARKVLEVLPMGDEIAIVGFDHEARVLNHFTTDRESTSAAITRMPNTGQHTNLPAGLQKAIAFLATRAPARRRVIILISDNVIDTETLRKIKVNKEAIYRKILEKEITVYSIRVGYYNDRSDATLYGADIGEILVRYLVRKTGGQIGSSRVGDVAKTLETAIEQLKNTYSLFYLPPKDSPGLRKVKVELRENPRSKVPPWQKKYQVISRKEYYFKK